MVVLSLHTLCSLCPFKASTAELRIFCTDANKVTVNLYNFSTVLRSVHLLGVLC